MLCVAKLPCVVPMVVFGLMLVAAVLVGNDHRHIGPEQLRRLQEWRENFQDMAVPGKESMQAGVYAEVLARLQLLEQDRQDRQLEMSLQAQSAQARAVSADVRKLNATMRKVQNRIHALEEQVIGLKAQLGHERRRMQRTGGAEYAHIITRNVNKLVV